MWLIIVVVAFAHKLHQYESYRFSVPVEKEFGENKNVSSDLFRVI